MKGTLLAICLVFVSCVTVTPQGAKVRITANPEAIRTCTLLGEVRGETMWGGMIGGTAEEHAVNELKNRAAAMGANTVLMVTSSAGFTGSVQRGEAYRCEIGAEKRAALSNVHISNVVRRPASNATLVSSFDISNANDFAVISVSVECTVSGIGGNPLTALPPLGPHQSRRVENILFSAGDVPDGPPVCRVLDLTILR